MKIYVNSKKTTADLSKYALKEDLHNYNNKITELLNMIESLNRRIEELESDAPEENIPCTSIKINQNSLELNGLNKTYLLIATVEPSNTTDTITWQSSSNAIASVSNGVVTSVGEGTCTITARCGSVSASCYVTVDIEEPEDPIEILIDEITIKVGETYDATKLYTLQEGYDVQYTYSSIIVIENEHTIVGKEVGITNLEIICGEIIKTVKINIVADEKECTSIRFTKTNLNVYIDQVTDLNGLLVIQPDGCTDPVEWIADNTILEMNNGVIKGLAEGSTKVQVRCGDLSANINIIVESKITEDPIEILIDEITIEVGETYDATRLYSLQEGYNVQYKYTSIIAIEDEHTIVGKVVGTTNLEIICGQIIKTVTVNVVAATENLGEGILLYKAGAQYNDTEFKNLCLTNASNSLTSNAICYELNVSNSHAWFSYDGYINYGDYDRVEITAYTEKSTQQPVIGLGLTTKSGQCGYESSSKWEGTSHSNVSLMYNVTETKYSLPITYTGSGYLLIWMNHASVALGKVYITEIRVIPKETENIACTGLTLNKSNLSFTSIGATDTIVATPTPSNTTDTVSWKSSNNDVATVTQFGLVTSRGNGTCTLTATCGNHSASCNVLVNIEESINTYSITNNLTNVSTNNLITSIEEGQSYSATLTCGDDYALSSVVVTMNGVDVTNSVYEPEDPDDPTISN